MVILIPWKPVVAAWCLLAAMLWVGYVGYSILEGKNPFAMAQHHSYKFSRSISRFSRQSLTRTAKY